MIRYARTRWSLLVLIAPLGACTVEARPPTMTVAVQAPPPPPPVAQAQNHEQDKSQQAGNAAPAAEEPAADDENAAAPIPIDAVPLPRARPVAANGTNKNLNRD